ncbi:acyl-CoA reductase-like NAD-dependent aldehyde dehydrogenase [Catenulispora sp. MAP12-49]|uniref:aldehyde dehydrogenase family protein n=1 Tax=unclassified Catenulispora TaxID=414885 RepID=UPI0035180C25
MVDHLPVRPDHLGNFVGGVWGPAAAGGTRADVSPGDTSDVLGRFADSTAADAVRAVDAAEAALPAWRALGPIKRAEYVRKAERIIGEREDEFARAISREQGKLYKEALGEVRRGMAILDFTAGEGRRLNGYTTPAEEPRTVAMTFRQPIGVVGLITPWNFPLTIPIWKVAPALVAGCTSVLKPSPFTPYSAALLVQAFADAGVPDGVLNLVQGDREPGEALTNDPRVAGISFTGSLPVGRAIHIAGAGRLMKTQLELGGKNAVLVLADADLDKAAAAIVFGAFGQAGQRCSATSRVVVDVAVKEALLEKVVAKVAALKVGSPFDPDADVCPVVNEDRMTACLDAITKAQEVGAKVAVGGRRHTDGVPEGYYVQPTVLRDVPWDCEIAQEEIFGPVLSVIDCDGFEDAMRISNSVKYGMSGTIFTQNPAHIFEALERFEAGMLHVNRPGVGAYAHLPHMGAKQSHYGAPECSPEVWDFYTEWRSACISF